MEELLSIAKDCVKKAKSEGAEFADTVVIKTKKIRIKLEKGGIKSCDSIMDEGTSTRVFINGARGFSSSMGIEKDLAIETAKRATDLSKLAEPDPDFVTLPQPGESKEVD